MKLIIFEYSCVCLDEKLLSEGLNMLQSILDDLEFNSSFDIDYLINDNVKMKSFKNLRPINLNCNLFEWLRKNSKNYDYALFIAPEDNLIQYTITKIFEDNNVKILGSDSHSSYICSSKLLTYNNTPNDILKIKTQNFNVDSISYDNISDFFKNKFIVKPDDRTSSDLVYLIKTKKEFDEIILLYKKNNVKKILVQEYIEGTSLSVSLIVNNNYIKCISLNSQEIIIKENRIKFIGCTSPFNHPLKDKIYEISKKIIRGIPGLKGFVGIDFIIQDKNIFFVEINSRFTTPFIILKQICNQNLTESIINLLIYNKKTELTFKETKNFILSD